MGDNSFFPKELKFTRLIFWLSAIGGFIYALLGFLGTSTAGLLNVVGYLINGTEEGVEVPIWLFNIFTYGVITFLFSVWILRLFAKCEPETPRKIVNTITLFILLELLFLLGTLAATDFVNFSLARFSYKLGLFGFFYLYITSQLRFLQSVKDHYGANAPPASVHFINDLGQGLMKYLQK